MWPQSPSLPPSPFCTLGGLGAADVASPLPMLPTPAIPPAPGLPKSCSTVSPHPCEAFTEPQGGSGLTLWGLSPPPAQVWDLGFLQNRGHRPDTWWADRQVTAESTIAPREAGWCPWCLCKRGHGSVLTVARADGTAETSGSIAVISPSAPPPSGPETAGFLDFGRQKAAGESGSSRLGLGPAA